MQKIALILTYFIVIICKGQSIILPLEERAKGVRIDGAYYKDLDNDLAPYEGTWTGKTKDGSIFKITFKKVKDYGPGWWKDRLYAQYEMRNKYDVLLYSTYNKPIENSKFKTGRFFKNKKILYSFFIDDCIEGHIKLQFTDNTKKQLEWEYISIPVTLHEIEGGPALKCAEINEMPQEKFILTKQ
jgi:hypothetical protein